MKKLILDAERSEQLVWSKLYNVNDDESGKELGLSSHKYLDADCLMMTRIPAWFFNRVIGLGLEQTVAEEDIDKLVQLYHENGVPIGISLCPEIQNEQFIRWLTNRNFSIVNHWVKMVRDTSPPRPANCDLRVEPVGRDQAKIAADIIIAGFELPELLKPIFSSFVCADFNRSYIAWEGDTPAAVGILSLVDEIGHLNSAATLPEFRGRGAQSAIMARRIQDGIKLGCKSFVTETWDPGGEVNHSYNNMLRQGFNLVYRRPNWVLDL